MNCNGTSHFKKESHSLIFRNEAVSVILSMKHKINIRLVIESKVLSYKGNLCPR